MKIEVNKNLVLDIKEEHLIIKNNKLYNTITKQVEGVDGDIVTFPILNEKGTKTLVRGTVDGYTCGNMVKLRGVEKPYSALEGEPKVFEHLTKITEDLKEDWETVLNA